MARKKIMVQTTKNYKFASGLTLSYGVMVAQQTLDLLVWVQILVGQQKRGCDEKTHPLFILFSGLKTSESDEVTHLFECF